MRANRARIAFSFADQASRNIGRLDGFSNLVYNIMLTIENAYLVGLPNIISEGDTLQTWSGVFLSCSMARDSPSLSSEPVGPMLSIKRSVLSLLDCYFSPAVIVRKCDQ